MSLNLNCQHKNRTSDNHLVCDKKEWEAKQLYLKSRYEQYTMAFVLVGHAEIWFVCILLAIDDSVFTQGIDILGNMICRIEKKNIFPAPSRYDSIITPV